MEDSSCVLIHARMYYVGMARRIKLRSGVLYAYCKEADISRDELARRMRVTPNTAYRVDSGRVDPSPAFIAAFMDVTGAKFEDLFEIVVEGAAA